MEAEKDKDSLKKYIQYLERVCRGKRLSLWQAHQDNIHREVAKEYGLTEEEMVWLDQNL